MENDQKGIGFLHYLKSGGLTFKHLIAMLILGFFGFACGALSNSLTAAIIGMSIGLIFVLERIIMGFLMSNHKVDWILPIQKIFNFFLKFLITGVILGSLGYGGGLMLFKSQPASIIGAVIGLILGIAVAIKIPISTNRSP